MLIFNLKIKIILKEFYPFLTGLHKVHPAYRMVNAGRVDGRL
jgi:hypothetical protein